MIQSSCWALHDAARSVFRRRRRAHIPALRRRSRRLANSSSITGIGAVLLGKLCRLFPRRRPGMPANVERHTLYGTLDYGAGYQTHGVPFNGVYPNGVEELISKNSNGRRYVLIPTARASCSIQSLTRA